VSDDTAHAIDEEVRRVVDELPARRKLLETNIDKLHAMAEALVQYETLDDRADRRHHGRRNAQPPVHWSDRGGDRPAAPPTRR
jgi:cell division protease FtsH